MYKQEKLGVTGGVFIPPSPPPSRAPSARQQRPCSTSSSVSSRTTRPGSGVFHLSAIGGTTSRRALPIFQQQLVPGDDTKTMSFPTLPAPPSTSSTRSNTRPNTGRSLRSSQRSNISTVDPQKESTQLQDWLKYQREKLDEAMREKRAQRLQELDDEAAHNPTVEELLDEIYNDDPAKSGSVRKGLGFLSQEEIESKSQSCRFSRSELKASQSHSPSNERSWSPSILDQHVSTYTSDKQQQHRKALARFFKKDNNKGFHQLVKEAAAAQEDQHLHGGTEEPSSSMSRSTTPRGTKRSGKALWSSLSTMQCLKLNEQPQYSNNSYSSFKQQGSSRIFTHIGSSNGVRKKPRMSFHTLVNTAVREEEIHRPLKQEDFMSQLNDIITRNTKMASKDERLNELQGLEHHSVLHPMHDMKLCEFDDLPVELKVTMMRHADHVVFAKDIPAATNGEMCSRQAPSSPRRIGYPKW